MNSHYFILHVEFRMLNCMQPIKIGIGNVASVEEENGYRLFKNKLSGSPGGGTPLCRHINDIRLEISSMVTKLQSNGQKVAVIINTDGEASDGDIIVAMRQLVALPVWVVIRLCTDDEKVAEYWDRVDKQLGKHM